MLEINEDRPIFLQIADGIRDGIVAGHFMEETQIPSITEFSVNYKINPATALKGINMLVEDGVLYKKRGVGMFVREGALNKLTQERKEEFFDNFIRKLCEEAKKLHLTSEEVVELVKKAMNA